MHRTNATLALTSRTDPLAIAMTAAASARRSTAA
jgi:hypothetical protein